MKIATFNINNVNKPPAPICSPGCGGRARRRLPAGAEGGRRRVPAAPRSPKAGYGAVWRGAEILERRRHPRARRRAGADPHDAARRSRRQRRRATSRRRSTACSIASLYAPNGNPQPGPKFDYKLAWMRAARRACRRAVRGRRAGGAGRRLQRRADRRDIYATGPMTTTRWCSRRAARAFARLLDQGWVDAIRTLHPDDADVHVLGLSAQPLAARRRAAPRSSPAQQGSRAAAPRRGRRSRGARHGQCQRPRAGMDRIARRAARNPEDAASQPLVRLARKAKAGVIATTHWSVNHPLMGEAGDRGARPPFFALAARTCRTWHHCKAPC